MQMVSRQMAKKTMEIHWRLQAGIYGVGKQTKDWIVVGSWSPDTHVSSGQKEDNWTYNSTLSDLPPELTRKRKRKREETIDKQRLSKKINKV